MAPRKGEDSAHVDWERQLSRGKQASSGARGASRAKACSAQGRVKRLIDKALHPVCRLSAKTGFRAYFFGISVYTGD